MTNCSMNCFTRNRFGHPLSSRQASASSVFFLAEEQDHQPQRQRRLGGGDDQHENHERLPGQVAVVTAEGDQINCRPLEHQLGAEKHDDQVPPAQEADHADAEHDRADGQIFLQDGLGHRNTAKRLAGGEKENCHR